LTVAIFAEPRLADIDPDPASKICSGRYCIGAMSHGRGTEASKLLHLRITCANLAMSGDDFIYQ